MLYIIIVNKYIINTPATS